MHRKYSTRVSVGVALLTGAALVVGLTQGVALARTATSSGTPMIARLKSVSVATEQVSRKTFTPSVSVTPHPVASPPAGKYAVTLSNSGAWQPAGSSGLALSATGTASSIKVNVQLLDQTSVRKLGLSGVVLRIARTDGSSTSAAVSVGVPRKLLDGMYGADYAGRVQWHQLPDCAAASCVRSTALKSSFLAVSTAGTKLAATQPLGSASASMLTARTLVGRQPILLAAASGNNASDGSGNFGATSLAASSQWQVSAQTGDFSWNYPLRTPPAAAGPAPDLALDYDSGSVDGQTGATNSQTSSVGNGWDLTGGGFIERSYIPCSSDGSAATVGDNCWKTDNAALSLNGQSQQLIKNAADGSWHVGDDDNTKVEHLTNDSTLCNNGTYDDDCWRLTSADGTQYYFGRNRLPGWTSTTQDTNSTWTEPVLGNNTGEPGFGGTCPGSSSFCTQAWRWNLDYVVDPHGNSEALYYATETNNYAENNSTTSSASYVRGGSLLRIDYGMRAGAELTTANAPEQVLFTNTDRCETGVAGEPGGACSETTPSPTYWPDVPWDQNCTTANCGTNNTPTFWSIKRLSNIKTQYWNGNNYVPVDSWALTQSWPDPGDGSVPSLQLDRLGDTGLVGGSVSMPDTRFQYTMLQNRLAPPNGIVGLSKPRLNNINLDSGGTIGVHYLASDCSATAPPTPETNTKRCFPQYWAPPGRPLALDWFEKYLVSSVNSSAVFGASPPTAGASTTDDVSTYDYSVGQPAWRLDTSPLVPDGQRTWSVFAGYSKVRVEHGDVSLPSSLQITDTTYFQGMAGDIGNATTGAVRTPTPALTASDGSGTTVTDSLWLAGRVFETKVYNGTTSPAGVVTDTVTAPATFSPTATAAAATEKVGTSTTTFSSVATARYSGDGDVLTHTALSAGGNRNTDTKTGYDSRGRVTNVDDLGDTSTSADDRCTTTSYADNTTTAWRLDYPAEVRTVSLKCASTPIFPANAISDTRVSYDGAASGVAPTVGDVTKTETVKDYDGSHQPIWLITATTTYDALGRSLMVTDALGNPTSTAYTPSAPVAGQPAAADIGPVTQSTSTNAMGWNTVSAIDPAWGQITDQRDSNLNETSATYDALGRRTAVWLPDRQPAANFTIPSVSYVYSVPVDGTGIVSGPPSIATTSLTPFEGTTKTSYQIFDGLMRTRQTQSPAEGIDQTTEFAAPGSNGSVITDTLYDSAGRVATTNSPYVLSTTAPSGTLWVPIHGEADIPGSTQTTYDGVGRAIKVATDSLGTEKWHTSTVYGGDHVDVTPPAGGTVTTTVTDARGNTTELAQYHGTSAVGLTDHTKYDATTYTYTPGGVKQASMTDQAGDVWSWTYDVRQRVISAVDPDTGTTGTTYDDGNRVATVTDNRGTVLAYSYDNLNRKTAEYQNSAVPASGILLASWTYDTLASSFDHGQLVSSSSYVGSTAGHPGTAYTKSVTSYDTMDRPLGISYTIPSVTGQAALAGTYTTTMSYNVDGSPNQQIDPAMGGLPSETLGYDYTSIGNPYSYGGQSPYLASILYDNLGRTSFVSHYNGSKRLEDTYTYSNDGINRLLSDTTTVSGTSNKIAGINYTYDDAGDLKSATNTPNNGVAVDTQCFNYDYLQRLTDAWTPNTGGCVATTPSSSNLAGPAPYWQSYSYSVAGNRLSMTSHSLTAGGTDKRDSYNYPTAGATAVRPNAVTSIVHATAPAGSSTYTNTGTDSYTYDAAGDTATGPGQTFSWNAKGKLGSFTKTSGSQTQSRVYDADGNLLTQSDPTNGTTAFLGDAELHLSASGTLTGQRTYDDLGRTVASRSATSGVSGSTLSWLDTDPHGTATISENPSTGATTIRRMDPFGNARGGAVTWPTDRGFLNAPADSFSGITTLGARDYNPVIGKFLSADPALDPANPQQNNGYSYAVNNPSTLSDPSGLMQGCEGPCHGDDNSKGNAPRTGVNTPPSDPFCGTRACGNGAVRGPGGGSSNSSTNTGGSGGHPKVKVITISADDIQRLEQSPCEGWGGKMCGEFSPKAQLQGAIDNYIDSKRPLWQQMLETVGIVLIFTGPIDPSGDLIDLLGSRIAARFGSQVVVRTAAEMAEGAANAANGVRLNAQLTGEQISGGHAFADHVVKAVEFPGITTRQEFASRIEDVVTNGESRSLLRGRTAYWEGNTVVIRDPASVDGGTAFVPTGGYNYFLGLK